MAPAAAASEATDKRKKDMRKLRPEKSIRKGQAKGKTKSSKNKELKSDDDEKGAVRPAASALTKVEKGDIQYATASQQLNFFVNQYQSANEVQLSALEIELLKDTSFIELCRDPMRQNMSKLDEQVKNAFGSSWQEVLCRGNLVQGQIVPGSPALLVISSSAIRSLELLRDLRSLTKECHAAKLFSKHMKIEEQVAVLKNRVNIASGTPSRIKKLIDMEVLGLSRLAVIVIDMHTDVKGYSVFTLKQISEDFWDLYKCYFHERLLEAKVRILLNGPIPLERRKMKKTASKDSS